MKDTVEQMREWMDSLNEVANSKKPSPAADPSMFREYMYKLAAGVSGTKKDAMGSGDAKMKSLHKNMEKAMDAFWKHTTDNYNWD